MNIVQVFIVKSKPKTNKKTFRMCFEFQFRIIFEIYIVGVYIIKEINRKNS